MKTLTTLALAALLLAPQYDALAATPINEQRPLNTTGQVDVENLKGKISVRTWAQSQVKIIGSLGKGAEGLEVSGDANRLLIKVKNPKNIRTGFFNWSDNQVEPTMLEITVPQRASLDLDAVSADIDVQQMAGARLQAESVSGDVVITASSPGEADVSSVSGDVRLRITTSRLNAETVSGDLHVSGGLSGKISVESVSGDVYLQGTKAESISSSTVSGNADIQIGLMPGGKINGESVSGDFNLTLPSTTDAKLEIESFSGSIESPVGKVKTEKYGPGSSLKASLGNGQGDISIDAFSGDVTVQLK